MELTFLGTASAYPTPSRGVSCIIFRNEGTYWMFDCGEGSQIQLMKSTIRPGKISKIFISHLHGDHLFGLPGLLCTLSQNFSPEAKATVELYGPVGLRRYIRTNLCLSRSQLSFDYVVHEMYISPECLQEGFGNWEVDHSSKGDLHPGEIEGTTILPDKSGIWHILDDERHTVKAGWLTHKVPSFGYIIEEKALPGKMDPALLKAKGVKPGPLYAKVKAGQTITSPSGETIRPEDVLGPERPGRKVVILCDTSNSQQMAPECCDADVMVHEATLEDEMELDCLQKGHSTPGMAGKFARDTKAKKLVITHFSQRYRALSQLSDSEKPEAEVCSVEKLIAQAVRAYGRSEVIAAEDLMTVPIPLPNS